MRSNERESTNKYRRTLSDREARVLSELSFEGKRIFTPSDLKTYTNSPKSILDSLIRKKWVLKIKKERYLIVPLEAGEKGAKDYTIHSFVIASALTEPYYISYWSALNYYGLTEQTPASVYIATQKSMKNRVILDIQFRFVTISPWKFFEINEVNIEKTKVKISSPEKTIADCLDHPEHCNGIQEVARALLFEKNEINADKVISCSMKLKNSSVIKRLGYIADQLGVEEIKQKLSGIDLKKGYSLLDPTLPRKGRIKEKWKIIVNTDIDPEKWFS